MQHSSPSEVLPRAIFKMRDAEDIERDVRMHLSELLVSFSRTPMPCETLEKVESKLSEAVATVREAREKKEMA